MEQSINNESWQCPNCNEIIKMIYDTCWNCQYVKQGNETIIKEDKIDFKTIQVEQKTDKELIDIYFKSHGQEKFIIEEGLTKRNIPIESIRQIKSEADEVNNINIESGVQDKTLWIILCFLAAILCGIISIAAGYIYAYSKRKDLQGETYYYYNEQTRKYGKLMLLVGIIALIIWFALNS